MTVTWLGIPPTPRAAAWLLRFAVLATGIGMASRVYHGAFTGINPYLFMTMEWPDTTAVQVERWAVVAMAVLGVIAFIRPWWPVLFAFAGLILFEAAARQHERGYDFHQWTLASECLRYLTPLALVLIVSGWTAGRLWALVSATWLLRVAVAVVFFSHGWAAFFLNPSFVDLLIGSAHNLLGMRLRQANAEMILWTIGIVDFTVAAMLLAFPKPPFVPQTRWAKLCAIWPIHRVILMVLLLWLSLWALITASARVTTWGWVFYGEVLVRMTHVMAPLAIGLLVAAREDPKRTERKQQALHETRRPTFNPFGRLLASPAAQHGRASSEVSSRECRTLRFASIISRSTSQ